MGKLTLFINIHKNAVENKAKRLFAALSLLTGKSKPTLYGLNLFHWVLDNARNYFLDVFSFLYQSFLIVHI